MADASAAQARGADAAWQSLVDAELAFAGAAASGPVSDAFLQVLAEDAVLFRPGPVPGRAATESNPTPPGQQLTWHPRIAAVASSGDLGFTSGPWIFRASPRDTVGGSGHYLSVWRRSVGEPWRLVLDVGVGHAPLPDHATVRDAVPLWGMEGAATVSSGPAQVAELHRLDDQMSELLARRSVDEAAARFGTRETVAYRNGAVPVTGVAPLREAAAPVGDGWRAERTGSGISTAGDLGYTYGSWSASENRRSYWVRIWRRTPDGWRLAACMLV